MATFFKVDGADPLAAGLDHILGAVGDGHIAVRVQIADIASAEPAIIGEGLCAGAPGNSCR